MFADLAGRALLVGLMAVSGQEENLPLLPVLVFGGLAGACPPRRTPRYGR